MRVDNVVKSDTAGVRSGELIVKVNHPTTAPNYYDQAGNLRSGDRISRTLLTGVEDDPGNYRLAYGTGGDSAQWTTPRHHHNFEQIRFPLEGDYSVGKNRKIPAGWVGYFPEAAYYGPQAISENVTMLLLQFGGPSGQGFASVAQRRKGYDGLTARGTLQNGIFSWVDEQGKHHNQDAFEAVWEEMNGRKIVYPEPRYEDIILMNPATFEWIPDPDTPGVSRRNLGTFTEKEVRISFIRLESGASIEFGTQPSTEILFIKDGRISHDGTELETLTAIGSAPEDHVETLTATEPTELFYMKLPTFAPVLAASAR